MRRPFVVPLPIGRRRCLGIHIVSWLFDDRAGGRSRQEAALGVPCSELTAGRFATSGAR